MPQFCEICAYPDQAAVRALAAGGSDREILLPFFGRPRFFGGGSATTFRPKPLAKASLDRAAAYWGATIGYDGGRPHLIRYSSGVV